MTRGDHPLHAAPPSPTPPVPQRRYRVKHLHILFCLALAAPLFAFWPSWQDPWEKEVDRACNASRYGMRLAAARKVAAAGDEAVPALRAYETKNGRTGVPSNIVDAIADADAGDNAVIALLTEWASDSDFYWRGQAMRGLANRAANLPAHQAALTALFTAHAKDPAWLTRTHARFGLCMLGDQTALQLPEADPRATPRLLWLLLAKGQTPPLQPLLDALADERTFLGDPWGQRLAKDAHDALRRWLGDDHPKADGQAFADKHEALVQLTAAASKKSGQELHVPTRRADADIVFTGGIEVQSCKAGDLFVRWTEAGELHFGLPGGAAVTVDATAWQKLSEERATLQLDELHGVVVCDSMRIQWQTPPVHSKIAPLSLPATVSAWLHDLAATVDTGSTTRLAADLRARLDQFSPR